MNKKVFILHVALGMLVLPMTGLAGGLNIPPTPGDTLNINGLINGIFNIVWSLFAGFAILAFILAGFLFLTAQGEPGKIKEARMAVVWGGVGITVALLSVTIPWLIKSLLGV